MSLAHRAFGFSGLAQTIREHDVPGGRRVEVKPASERERTNQWFCRENNDRSDLVIASLDWGFNEQLAFLADQPQLVEPFWAFPRYNGRLPALPQRSGYIYLAHSPEYSLFGYDVSYLNELQTSGEAVDIQPHSDRQGQVVFYTIQFRE